MKAILTLARENQVGLTFFILPLNERMIAHMKAQGVYKGFTQWKRNVKSLMMDNDTLIYDFSEDIPHYHDSAENGSTKFWIDTSHYSPIVGRWMLNKINFHGQSIYGRISSERLTPCTKLLVNI